MKSSIDLLTAVDENSSPFLYLRASSGQIVTHKNIRNPLIAIFLNSEKKVLYMEIMPTCIGVMHSSCLEYFSILLTFSFFRSDVYRMFISTYLILRVLTDTHPVLGLPHIYGSHVKLVATLCRSLLNTSSLTTQPDLIHLGMNNYG